MRHLSPAMTALLVVLPGPAYAQLDILLSGARPAVRTSIGPFSVTATLGGANGIELDVADAPTARRTTTTPRRTTGSTVPRRTETTGRKTGGARATAAGVLATAENYLGTRYVWGGESPSGFDCSGFVQYVFRRHGIELPRTSRQQAHVGQIVTAARHALRPGDLMFFATRGVRIDHIAIYAGHDEIIHSSRSGGGVGYDRLSTRRGKWFTDHHVATRRVLANGYSLVAPLSKALRAFAQFDPPDFGPAR